MKTSEIKWLTMLLFTAMLFITACSDDTIRPPYLEEEIEPTPETKEFVVYDAMSYKNKPDLTSDMISNIRLIYEAFLLTNEEIDMDKVATQISITKTSNYPYASDGAVNIDGLLRRLEKDGYTGFCTMEPHTTPEKCLDFYREETAYLRERGIKE